MPPPDQSGGTGWDDKFGVNWMVDPQGVPRDAAGRPWAGGLLVALVCAWREGRWRHLIRGDAGQLRSERCPKSCSIWPSVVLRSGDRKRPATSFAPRQDRWLAASEGRAQDGRQGRL